MVVVEGAQMSPQQTTYTRDELVDLAERESREMLGISWSDALNELEAGTLDGTAAEAELRMLRFLLG